MKRRARMVLVVTMACAAEWGAGAATRNARAQTAFGFRAGAGLSSVRSPLIADPEPAVQVGTGVFLTVQVSDKVVLQPELQLERRGIAAFADSGPGLDFTYLMASALVRRTLLAFRGHSIAVFAGPALAFRTRCWVDYDKGYHCDAVWYGYTFPGPMAPRDRLPTHQLGIFGVGGVGLTHPLGSDFGGGNVVVDVDARVQYGLTSFLDISDLAGAAHHVGVSVTAGLAFVL